MDITEPETRKQKTRYAQITHLDLSGQIGRIWETE
jgi:hypothetical protein